MFRILIVLMAFAFWPLFMIVKVMNRKLNEAAARREKARLAALRRKRRRARNDPFDDIDFIRRMYGSPYGYPYSRYRSPSPDYMMWLPFWLLWFVVIWQIIDNK